MKLGIWSKPDKWLAEIGYDLGQADILEAHRFIYLFFDQNALDNHNFKRTIKGETIYGKAIQINLSISKGGKDNFDLMPWMRKCDNSTHMIASMYTYDTVFDTDITNIYSAKFILNEAMISSTMNDYNLSKAMLCGENYYSKDLRNSDTKRELISRFVNVNASEIQDPMYYTIRHQEICEGDVYSLNSINSVIEHEGKELYDDNTRVSVMNMSLIATLEPKMKKKIYDVRHQVRNSDYKLNTYDQTQLSEDLLCTEFETMQHGYTYIYDSQAGINIVSNEIVNGRIKKTGYLPFKKYQFNDKLQEDIERTLRMIKNHAREVEQQFGSVRLHFTPLYFGDKADVYFKDWKPDHQPVIKDKVDIDNSFKLTNELATISTEVENIYDGGDDEVDSDEESGWDFSD
jgi:hypothetical protein